MKRILMPPTHLPVASGRWRPSPAARRTAAVLITTTTLALLVAACGASKTASGTSGSTSTATATISQAVTFTRCMRSHGVSNYPDPNARNSGPGTNGLPKVNLQALGVSSSLVDRAEGACQRVLPDGAQLSRHASRSILDRLVAFGRCMRFHGVSNWPDPTRTLGNFPGSPRYGFDLQGIQGLEAGASGSFGPRINTAIGHCLRLQHLTNSQVPWGAWQR
jgi:hypothetical protein